MNSNRREFLKTLAASSAALAINPRTALLGPAVAESEKHPTPGSLDFVFFTDTHIQPELDAAHGCAMAFQKIAALKPEFAIHGGDLVFDALAVNRPRADLLFDLYQKTEAQLNVPLYHAIGNHDVFGILTKSGIQPDDPHYAKKMFEDRIGARTYSSFDRKGYHFIILDSIFPTDDRQWEGRVDDAQLQWLASDLKSLPAATPILVISHVPLVTGFLGYFAQARRPPEIQYLQRRKFSRRHRPLRKSPRHRRPAGTPARERNRPLQKLRLPDLRRRLRQLVARFAHGFPRRFHHGELA